MEKYYEPMQIELVKKNIVKMTNGQWWSMDRLAKCGAGYEDGDRDMDSRCRKSGSNPTWNTPANSTSERHQERIPSNNMPVRLRSAPYKLKDYVYS